LTRRKHSWLGLTLSAVTSGHALQTSSVFFSCVCYLYETSHLSLCESTKGRGPRPLHPESGQEQKLIMKLQADDASCSLTHDAYTTTCVRTQQSTSSRCVCGWAYWLTAFVLSSLLRTPGDTQPPPRSLCPLPLLLYHDYFLVAPVWLATPMILARIFSWSPR
jgi:hypothetical protein